MGCGTSRDTTGHVTGNSQLPVFSNPLYVDVDTAWDIANKSIEVKKVGAMEKKLVVKRRGWKTVRIFVSSTFKDFQHEREVLVKKVFPDLRAWCESRLLYLVDVDLRWGVPKDFNNEEKLRSCLGEIDRCYHENVMPFFINLNSERVGWVPAGQEIPEGILSAYKWVEGLSVTEMEIMHGAYRKDNPNALFMLRDPSFLDNVPQEYRSAFIEDENELEKAKYKQKVLRRMIDDRFPANRVVRYQVSYVNFDETKDIVELGGLDGIFSTQVFDFFKKRIDAQYPLPETVQNPFEQRREMHESFLKSRSDTVIGRDHILEQINEYICSTASADVPLLIVAGPGTGKSSLMAKAADLAVNKALTGSIGSSKGKVNWHVFYHFVGAVPGSTELLTMLCRLLYELKAIPEARLPRDVDTAAQVACGVLNNPNTKPTIIIVDALNQMDDDTPSILMSWVPRKLSPQIRCVFTMITGTPQHQAFSAREPKPLFLELEPLTKEDRKEIVTQQLGMYNKQLDNEQMETLLNKQSSENPLWLSVACEELRVFGRFREISDKINQLTDGLLELLGQILDRFEEENGGELLKATLCLLEMSERGLLEIELLTILGDEDHLMPSSSRRGSSASGTGRRPSEAGVRNYRWTEGNDEEKEEESTVRKDRGREKTTTDIGLLPAFKWSSVYRALRPFLRPFGDSGEGRLDFYHRSLSKAVRKKYFTLSDGAKDKRSQRWWRQKLAKHFEHCTNLQRKIEEYPYHLIAIDGREKLETFLTDWSTFDELFNEDYSFKLLTFWRKGSSYERCEDNYEIIANNLVNSSTDRSAICQRFMQMANLLQQAGRYDKALEFAEKAQSIEEQELGARPDRMADLCQMCASIKDEKLKLIEYMYASQIPEILNVINMFQRCIDYRRNLDGPQNKNRLGNALNRIAFYYSGVSMRGGSNEITVVEGRRLAMESIDESVTIFKELNDEAKVANSLITKGVAYGSSCSAQLKAYKDAEEILLRVTGRLHPFVDRLYLNMGISYEESGDIEKAFDCFYEWFKVCKNLYGLEHRKTKRPISTLHEQQYLRIAKARNIPIPAQPAE